MVGATPLGVEMAGNLGQRGLEVHFIDEGPWVLHEVLDPDVAEPVHESLTKRGVTLHLGTAVEAFLGDDHVRAVATSQGEIACDVVIVCLHKVPNRFQLVLAATYRARMLSQGHAPKIESKNKPGVTALREIAAGEVGVEMLRRVPI